MLSAIHTSHIKDSNESYGIKLSMNYSETVIMGYTSDTAYFSELNNFFNETDILIFNVSDIYRKDVKGIKDKNSHLGYNGSVKLLKRIKGKLAIASEFCCTNGDFRIDFINTLSNEIGGENNINIIPGEIGLNVLLPSLQIQCSICKKMISRKNIRILAPNKEYGKIQYLCRDCVRDVL